VVAAVAAAAETTGSLAGTETGAGVADTTGADATGCFLEGVGGIIYYFMITYIIICLYHFIDSVIKNIKYKNIYYEIIGGIFGYTKYYEVIRSYTKYYEVIRSITLVIVVVVVV
jgi:hypothetical protein